MLSHTAKIARAATEMLTYAGRPCKKGHSGERYLSNYTCIECTKAQQRSAELLRQQRMNSDSAFYEHRRTQKNKTSSKWRKAHRGEKSAEWAAWRALRSQRTPVWVNLQGIKDIYTAAAAVQRLTGVPRHVDHILPLNGALVSGLHVAENLQILTKRDNLLKGARFDVD